MTSSELAIMIGQLVEHWICITKVMGLNPIQVYNQQAFPNSLDSLKILWWSGDEYVGTFTSKNL